MFAGFVATAAMTVVMYAAPSMGMPDTDIAALIGWVISPSMPEPMTPIWWVGMFAHFVNGSIIFPLIYAFVIYPVLRGEPWLRGIQWGMMLWFLAQTVAMPLIFCMGFFTRLSPQPVLAVLGSLAGHFLYGVLLGLIAGPQAARLPSFRRQVPTGTR
jgi:hypothetical protein